jgi:hypothetical protein
VHLTFRSGCNLFSPSTSNYTNTSRTHPGKWYWFNPGRFPSFCLSQSGFPYICWRHFSFNPTAKSGWFFHAHDAARKISLVRPQMHRICFVIRNHNARRRAGRAIGPARALPPCPTRTFLPTQGLCSVIRKSVQGHHQSVQIKKSMRIKRLFQSKPSDAYRRKLSIPFRR